jgi:hypothetical protein
VDDDQLEISRRVTVNNGEGLHEDAKRCNEIIVHAADNRGKVS